MEWEEIFASHMLDKGLLILYIYIFKLYQELIQLKIKKKTTQYFSREDKQLTNR